MLASPGDMQILKTIIKFMLLGKLSIRPFINFQLMIIYHCSLSGKIELK